MNSTEVGRKSIVMVGGPNTGKSHFTFQLFGRLSDKKCQLKLVKMPNLELFKDGLERLNRGLAAEHTNADKYDNADLRMEDIKGNVYDLLWPDYGGEQISQILSKRGLDSAWKERLQNAEGILLFVRLGETIDYKNIIHHPLEVVLKRKTEQVDDHKEPDLSSQAGIVEMLQVLIWTMQKVDVNQISVPKLVVLLTCWDELGLSESSPIEALQSKAPMLEQYIRATWKTDSYAVLGLSSLERALDKDKSDEEFVSKGPERFGYLVDTNGIRTQDLTVCILKLLEMLDES